MCFSVLGPCFVVCFSAPSSLAIILLRKRELVAILKLCCCCPCSVFLPCGALCSSAVCDCGISWQYSLALCGSPLVYEFPCILMAL